MKTHGHSRRGQRSKTYRSWDMMLDRCRNPKSSAWAFYGGRGIAVCKRWEKFENFLADMGECPAALTLDRINSDSDYKPSNCRWASRTVQMQNRRGWSKKGLPKGVHERRGKFRARIRNCGKLINLGTFLTIREANLAYQKAAQKYFVGCSQ